MKLTKHQRHRSETTTPLRAFSPLPLVATALILITQSSQGPRFTALALAQSHSDTWWPAESIARIQGANLLQATDKPPTQETNQATHLQTSADTESAAPSIHPSPTPSRNSKPHTHHTLTLNSPTPGGHEEERKLPGRRRKLWQTDAKWRYREVKRRRRAGDCWSRHEQHLFYKDLPMSEHLEDALRNYQKMHQRCTDIADWNAYSELLVWEKQKERGEQNGCKYIIYADPLGHGLGNRIINLVSTFALALVTNRTLLMKHDSPIVDFFCNPFRFSSWALDTKQWSGLIDNTWKDVRRMENFKGGNIWDNWTGRRQFHVSINWNSGEINGHFFCPDYHKQVFQYIPVLSVESDEYFIPALYFIPEFAEMLNRLVPDGRVFTHLGRFLLHPSNKVWLRVSRFYDSYLAHHTRLVGVQIRKFWPCDDPVDGRVMDCVFNVSKVLPPSLTPEEFLEKVDLSDRPQAAVKERESIGVFMASLNRTFSDILGDYANSRVMERGQLVGVYSLSHENFEKHDYRQYEVALVEMLLLSMCDELLTTDFSTFGYVAAGLSGVMPYSMNIVVHGGGDFRTNGRGTCEVISSEPCFHYFPGGANELKCGETSTKLTDLSPNVGFCDAVGVGLQNKITKE